MDIVKWMINSLSGCTDKNQYVFLLNELLSLFPRHAEKSLKLCLKSKIKKYICIIDNPPSNRCPSTVRQLRKKSKKWRWIRQDACLSDCTDVVTAQRSRGPVSEDFFPELTKNKKKLKKARFHFFVVCGNYQKYLVSQNFCSCFYFKDKVLCTNTDVVCKHILSVLLSEIFKNYEEVILGPSLFYAWLRKKLRR